MSRIIPIPTTRVGDFFVRQRLVNQVQGDQLDLFRLQSQVSTGRRITLPSEDVPAALRAINVQRTLQRKAQVNTNLEGSRSVLGGADSSLADVSKLLNDIHGSALEIVNTTSSDSARQAAVQAIDSALKELVNIGNTNYAGRYLFSGSRTDQLPFNYDGSFVQYSGNEKNLQNFVDVGQLFDTNVPGSDVFGGLSAQVRGTVDLNPQLTSGTLLSSLNGGEGIGPNPAISVTFETGGPATSSIIDLSGAVTVGDVARLIEDHAPAGANVKVDVNSANGLTVTSGAGNIRISEVAAGRTAHELGIFTPTTVAASPTITGSDLDPAVRNTTLLSDLVGSRSTGRVTQASANNDLVFTATQNGAAYDGLNVVYVSDVPAGSETASYVSGTKTLTVHIQDGASTANQVAAAVNAAAALGNVPFTATADYRDATNLSQAGTGKVSIGSYSAVTANGSGTSLDTTSGIVLTNGGKSVTLDISNAETVEDLLNQINGAGVGLVARRNAGQNGIDVRSTLSGADFTIGENGGTTATQLGIRTYDGSTRLSDFNRGVGVPTADVVGALDSSKLDSLTIVARDGTSLSVSLTGASTPQEIANRINAATGNNTGTTAVLARLTANGNGIQLVDSSTATTGPLTVQAPTGTAAATYLGLVPTGQTQATSTTTDGSGNYVLTGTSVVNNDLSITARSGVQFAVDLTGAVTVQDAINRINDAASDAGVPLTAKLATNGNGIELVDASVGTGTLAVAGVEGSEAAKFLGFLPNGTVTTDGSGNQVLQSEDRHTLEVDSVFNSLLRLRDAIQANDVPAIGTAITRLDDDLNRVNFARAEVGSRLQSLDTIQARLQDENVQLKSALSNDIDVDLVEAISNLTARQYALQASLQTAANILNLSILDYL